ncbi:hypothetical protein TrVFT333_005225 [Trichoderma virens FT-333]|nr:hypothetical protein TrVFT333_005225 [Trichoderma virens FT-333]
MSETNVWLYGLPNYQGAVYEYDGSQYGCKTVGEGVTKDCQLGSKLFNISADGRDLPLAPNFGVRSIECETWEP